MPGETCDVFANPMFKKSGSWEISTSNVSNDFYDGFGYGQVVPYGIGCGYVIKADKIIFNCTMRNNRGDDNTPYEFVSQVRDALDIMHSISKEFKPEKPNLELQIPTSVSQPARKSSKAKKSKKK